MAPFEEINIPQKPPMVMIDRVVSVAGQETVTSFIVRAGNVFCEDGYLREPGLIENMAQTAAAGAGRKPGVESGKPPLGFIGGIKNLHIYHLPHIGTELTTKVYVEHEVFDATVINAKIFSAETLIAECELKIFLIKT